MSIIQGNAHTSAGGYQIERSLRFNSADSAYLNRTPASAGNRRTWTWSGWVKRCNSATTNSLFSAYVDGNNFFLIQFRENGDNGRFEVFNYSSAFDWRVETNALLRDPSAWYHIVVALDTTQATDSNRIKIYVNGTLQTLATTTYPSLNFDSDANNNIAHYIGQDGGNGRYHNGYLTEVNFIDGSAKTPSDFGETDSATGVWKPKAYSSTYGTNGFYLKFADNSGTTSTTLGKDSSGNGNNWTPNNFSVTAGAGNDSLLDSPTAYGTDTGVGGEVRGNYATLNPLDRSSNITTSNGNLDFAGSANSFSRIRASVAMTTGKWYAEFVINTEGAPSRIQGGIMGQSSGLTSYLGTDAKSWSMYESSTNILKVNNNSTSTLASSNSLDPGDVQMFAYDADAGKLWFGKNGSWFASGNPAGGTNETFSSVSGEPMFFASSAYNTSDTGTWNFGQRAFAYTAPSGFKALCTQNLPTPTIGATSTTQANDYFNPVLYTGTGSSLGVTGVGFQPDFVWIKGRSGATDHGLYDAVRGVQKQLESNTTTAETTETTGLTAFGSDGFTVGALAQLNTNTATYVAWQWKANGAGSSNTAGTITSTVSASTTSGFSIVSFAFPAVASKTVGHGLGVAPSMVIVKSRSNGTQQWVTYHASSGNTGFLCLNKTDAFSTNSTVWDNTSPTSTVFTLGSGFTSGNFGANGIAYCFAPVAGYSAFGSYTGNNLDDGPFIFTNFRPAFVLIKATNTTQWWTLLDSKRDTYNVSTLGISPNSSDAESTFNTNRGPHNIDFTSNGFKIRTSGSGINGTNTFIYAAFAESPFKYSLGR